ncbi:hypothetical protein D7D52_09995 [Nocardia yunnanensis]|uniref:Uncharacterized protein n=1 Tax=Nocardia yunnanensis TaxID=2382165 RepID=A0A386Z912_9NOCA|nr:hypothetical protein D7D52_09995 [Nocardia yunnanensis]
MDCQGLYRIATALHSLVVTPDMPIVSCRGSGYFGTSETSDIWWIQKAKRLPLVAQRMRPR